MAAVFEKVRFEFHLTALDKIGYGERRECLKEVESISNLEVSAVCVSAAFGGAETFLITILAATSDVVTIADFLHRYFSKNKNKEDGQSLVTS